MTVLIDTSVLLAYAFSRDVNHDLASRALREVAQETRIVPVPVLTELFYSDDGTGQLQACSTNVCDNTHCF